MAGLPLLDILLPQLAVASTAASLGFTIYRIWKEAKAHKQETIVSNYWGYSSGHKQEDDSKIRAFLSQEVDRGRSNLRTAIDLMVKAKKAGAVGPLRDCLDELDMLLNEIRLGPTQKAVIFMDKHGKINEASVEKLKSMDLDVIHKLSVIAETTRRLSEMIVDGKDVNLSLEYNRIRLFIQKTREIYRSRVNVFETAS